MAVGAKGRFTPFLRGVVWGLYRGGWTSSAIAAEVRPCHVEARSTILSLVNSEIQSDG